MKNEGRNTMKPTPDSITLNKGWAKPNLSQIISGISRFLGKYSPLLLASLLLLAKKITDKYYRTCTRFCTYVLHTISYYIIDTFSITLVATLFAIFTQISHQNTANPPRSNRALAKTPTPYVEILEGIVIPSPDRPEIYNLGRTIMTMSSL